jgi:integrase
MSTTLTEEQVQRLRDHLKGHPLEAILTLALVTGLRRDELLALKWQDVDLEECCLSFQNTKTKNRESLPIQASVAEILQQHLEAQLRANVVWSNFVFPDERGVPLNPHQLVKGFHEVRDLAGLPRISFHDLRHTVAQNLYNTLKQKGREHNDHD